VTKENETVNVVERAEVLFNISQSLEDSEHRTESGRGDAPSPLASSSPCLGTRSLAFPHMHCIVSFIQVQYTYDTSMSYSVPSIKTAHKDFLYHITFTDNRQHTQYYGTRYEAQVTQSHILVEHDRPSEGMYLW
jgi:hypothetical protein